MGWLNWRLNPIEEVLMPLRNTRVAVDWWAFIAVWGRAIDKV